MRSLFDVVGVLVFLCCAAVFAMSHGEHWKVGPLGMPEILVAPDGAHYPDGVEIDPISLQLHEGGLEQSVGWGFFAGLATMLLFSAHAARKNRGLG